MKQSLQARFFLFLLLFQFAALVLLACTGPEGTNPKGSSLQTADKSCAYLIEDAYCVELEEEDGLDAMPEFCCIGFDFLSLTGCPSHTIFLQANLQLAIPVKADLFVIYRNLRI